MVQVKTKIQSTVLIEIVALVLIFMSIIIYLFYHQSHKKDLAFEQLIKRSEQCALVDLDRYLSKRLEVMCGTEAILKAFQNRDREQLHRLIHKQFRVIESELPGSVSLLFCTPDSVALWRAHRQEQYNDDLMDIRPMIVEANSLQQTQRGFEAGKYSVNYRVAMPVTFHGQYLGVIEIGTGVEYIMESIYEHFSLSAALYLNPEYLIHYDKEKGISTTSGKYLFLSNNMQLFSNLYTLKTIATRKIQIDNKRYRLHAHNPIANFQGKKIGTLVFLQDINQEYALLIKTVGSTIALSLMIFVLAWILLDKFIRKIINELIASKKKALQSEDELRKFKIIFDSVNYGVTTVDMAGRIMDVNRYFAATHGYNVQELYGRHMSIFYTDEQVEVVEKINRDCLEEGAYGTVTVMHKHKDGSLFPMEMNGVVVKDWLGKPLFWVGMAIDITERVQLEQKLNNYRDDLEMIVARRTEELTVSNEKLHHEIKERLEIEVDLFENQQLLPAILDN